MSSGTSPATTKKLPNYVPPSEKLLLDSTGMTELSDSYECRVAHAESIKVVNNRYSTPVTLNFIAVTKERTVNIAQKYNIIFTAIKLRDPSATIKSLKGVVYINPKKTSLVARHIKILLT